MSLNNHKSELTYISQYSGMREDYVQAGGGNTSVKENESRMYIKSSGFQLTEVSETTGYSIVNPKVIVDFFNRTALDDIVKEDENKIMAACLIEGKRPSIEVFLHSITERVTIHSHSVVIDILASRKGGMQILQEIAPEAIAVPYATPGIDLAKAYFCAWKESGKETVKVAFLENHGLLVSAKTAKDAVELHESIILKVAKYLKLDYSSYTECTNIWKALRELGIENQIVYLMNDRRIYEAYDKTGTSWDFAVCPDCVVYCGKKVLVLPERYSSEGIRAFSRNYGTPIVILYHHQFYAVAADVKKAKEIESLFSFSAQVVLNNMMGQLNYLTDEEQNFLLNWDAEKYRRNMK